MKIIFSDRALEDLDQIGHYIAKGSLHNARRHLQKLVARTRQLTKYPRSGRVVPEYNELHLREIIEGNYRIVYEIHEKKQTIFIITIFESHHLL